MHLVFNHVAEFQHVSHTNRCLLVESLTSSAIIKLRRAVARQASLVCPLTQVFEFRTIEDWRSELHAEFLTSCTEHGLENQTQVHT